MLTVGIDPSTTHPAIALCDGSRLVTTHIVKVPSGRSGVHALCRLAEALQVFEPPAGLMVDAGRVERVAVEHQKFRTHGGRRRSKPNDLIVLGHATGMMMVLARCAWPNAKIALPEPAEWSNVPKPIRHKRIRSRLGDSAERLKGTYIEDRADAVGLALWAQAAHEKFFRHD